MAQKIELANLKKLVQCKRRPQNAVPGRNLCAFVQKIFSVAYLVSVSHPLSVKETMIAGSFDFTKAAEEKNAENLIIIKSKELAGIYIGNWNRHREHSERYEARY
jgi:hypothetical protein